MQINKYSILYNEKNQNWFHEVNKSKNSCMKLIDSDFLQQALAILKFARINDIIYDNILLL